MRKIRIEDAVGKILGHDVTQIIPERYKGPRFKKGHKIRKEDIPEFLRIGKEHVFVMELKPGIIHEDDAAIRLGKAFAGENIKTTGPSEGKVTFYSKIKGLLQINLPLLHRINLSKNIILSTIHRHTPCTPGMAVGATRIISLTTSEREIQKVENWCEKYGPIIEVIPYRKLKIGVVVTGNEIFYGTPILPGAMFLYGILGKKPILGLPACVFYHKATLFDILFPRILAGESISRKEISLLGHGGFV